MTKERMLPHLLIHAAHLGIARELGFFVKDFLLSVFG
jgi:hypothetical protein